MYVCMYVCMRVCVCVCVCVCWHKKDLAKQNITPKFDIP